LDSDVSSPNALRTVAASFVAVPTTSFLLDALARALTISLPETVSAALNEIV